MNEETGVKVPVTRLRRRLSVEQSEDGKSSPAIGTPTKKRGGRRAAKPELDLINENAAENNLKKTAKKTVAKDVADSESEKTMTPSRRSARIKSNTSIVSDTVQNVDSPRARRAARRISQVGSDTEMNLTPARTRRTRKDSSSSVEKQVVSTPTAATNQIPEIIIEEPDNSTKSTKDESKTSDNESTTEPTRRSPRLVKKNSRNSNSSPQEEGINDSIDSNNVLKITTESNSNDAIGPDIKSDTHTDTQEDTNSDKNRLSVSSCDLIKNLKDKPKDVYSHVNKSLSEAQDINKMKSKRHRTKSWTTITDVSTNHEDYYSDNEMVKKKHLKKLSDDITKKTINSGSGDNMHNHSNHGELNSSQNKVTSSGKKKKRETISEKSSKESEVRELFQKDPSGSIQKIIVMEDSDSNSLEVKLLSDNNGDQCVPVVDHKLKSKDNESPEFTLSTSFNKNKNESIVSSKVINNTCEPMDVDETLPECLPNVSVKGSENPEKSLLHNTMETNGSVINKSSNKSNRKSIGLSTSQNLEKSNTENKSTLVLSQIKNLSNSETKSPKISKKEQLSESTNILNITKENEKPKKNPLNYLTSTPLQQKANLGDNGKNKSNIFDINVSKNKVNVTPKKNVSDIGNRSDQTSEESESDEELESSKTSDLLDNEADEVSDNYESGDSRDEDEKQYERDHEIVEKGETLTSEDEVSNDSDYGKDSFVVTSDEEDNELLSGSGDDLSMTDNELKMNPKSKKKYDAKKLKEQKQASREMYESRHKIKSSKKDQSSRSSEIKEISRERLDSSNSEDDIKFTKKNKRMRLDSTATDSINVSKIENIDSIKKDMDMSSSSYNENILKEKEITINEKTTENIDDPLALHVKKENTSIKEQNMSIDFVDTDVQKDDPTNTNTPNWNSQESKNPLEDSDNDTSSSLSTEDENIAQNYNDVLNDLKVKTANHSLNIEKKSKKKLSTPIVDHLNITQTKALKIRNKSEQKDNTITNSNGQNNKNTENWSVTNYVNQESDQNMSKTEDTASISDNKKDKFRDSSLNLGKKSKKESKSSLVDQLNLTLGNNKSKINKSEKTKSNNSNTNEDLNDDDSSDSIDLKLLFSEDSINSSDFNKSVKKAENNTDNFIPLKKSEAKTDIRAAKDPADNENTEVPFFVDTIGNQSTDDEGIENEKNFHQETQEEDSSDEEDSSEEPLETSYKKEKNEKFVKKNKEVDVVDIDVTGHGTKTLTDRSLLKTPQSEKKQKKSLSKNLSLIENISDKSLTKDNRKKKTSTSFNVSNLDVLFSVENIMENDDNKSFNKAPGSEKKKVRKLSQSNGSEVELNNTEVALNKSIAKTPKSEKKKKKLSENSETLDLIDKISDEPMDNQHNANKLIAKTPGSEKKMKKLSQSNGSDVELNNTEVELNKSIGKTPKSEKTKKKLSVSENSETLDLIDKISEEPVDGQHNANKSIPKTPGSEKKKAKKWSQSNGSDVELNNTEVALNKSVGKTPNSEKNKKKLSVPENSETLNLSDKISENEQNLERKKKRLSQINNEIKENQNKTIENTDSRNTSDGAIINSKKRKRSSVNDAALEDAVSTTNIPENESLVSNKKKRKISQKSEENYTKGEFNPEENIEIYVKQNTKADTNKAINEQPNTSQKKVTNKRNKKSSDSTSGDLEKSCEAIVMNTKKVQSEGKIEDDNETGNLKAKGDKNKKRKNRDDDNVANVASKVRKENSLDNIHVSRLPLSFLNKLDDKPNTVKPALKKQRVISTTGFKVEETRKRKNKPSNYLEESIYLNDDESMDEHKKKTIIKNPKVLPFVPTATTSNSGYTTNFQVNVLPKEIKFVAQSNNVNSFKNEYLYGKKIKRLGTYDLYKRNRNIKISKF